MNPELIWWSIDNIWSAGEVIDITDEALSAAMEQSRRSAQAAYRTWWNHALNNQVAKFLEYIVKHEKSEQLLKPIAIFMQNPNSVLFGEYALFLAPFLSQAADEYSINQIYNINYHIKASKSEYTAYINNLINNTYTVSGTVKTEAISTMDKIEFAKIDQDKLWFYVDNLIDLFWRENDNIAMDNK